MNKRCIADIAELQSDIYMNQGIYYIADEQNTFHGWACVFGPAETPYEDCPMLYEFWIPTTFPFDNPKVEFRTHDGSTRFHPNMYKEGKCCLSILGTWEGPRWASTMRLSTILITLQSLMDTEPLRHEPGYVNEKGEVGKKYAKWVEHSCLQYIVSCAEGKNKSEIFAHFQPMFDEKRGEILERVEKRLEALSTSELSVNLPYGMLGTTNYGKLLERVKKLRQV